MQPEEEEIIDDTTIEITMDNIKSFIPRFPISKVKRIAKVDPDYIITANTAIVAAAFATELFVQSLTESALALSQLNNNAKKPTKNARLTYNDLAESVMRKEGFQFLEDALPKVNNMSTITKKPRVQQLDPNTSVDIEENNNTNKQSTLPFFKPQKDITENSDDTGDEIIEEVELKSEVDELESDNMVVDEDEEDEEVEQTLKEVEQLNHVLDLDINEDAISGALALTGNKDENIDALDEEDSDSSI